MNNNIRKPSAVIFDFDDTLVDARPIINNSLFATLEEFNIPKSIIDLKNIDINHSMRDYFHQIFGNNVYQARDIYYKFYTEFSKELKMLENADKVLDFLKSQKAFISVVSNKNGNRLRDEISNKFFWNEYFFSIIGSGDAAEDKPSIKPAILALSKLKLTKFDDVLIIGDSAVDLKLAENLGCQAILFGNAKIDAKTRVANHIELLELLRSIY